MPDARQFMTHGERSQIGLRWISLHFCMGRVLEFRSVGVLSMIKSDDRGDQGSMGNVAVLGNMVSYYFL